MIRLALRVPRGQAELALAELVSVVPGGVEEVDLGDRIEYAIYGAPGELPTLPDLHAAIGDTLVEVVTTEVADDWHERWKAFHQPITISDRLHVRPPWAPSAPAGLQELVIDPGQAFGTGAHDTTRLCLELLCGLEPGGALMDLGCGSGVLAIAAAKLGFGPVSGVDHERASVAATAENASANGVTVDVGLFDLLRDGPAPSAPTVVANLLRPLLLTVAANGFAGNPPERLIVSGLLRDQVDEVATSFTRHGLRETARRESSEWAAVLLVRDAESTQVVWGTTSSTEDPGAWVDGLVSCRNVARGRRSVRTFRARCSSVVHSSTGGRRTPAPTSE